MDPNPPHAFPMHVVIVSSVLKFLNYWNYKAWSSTRRKNCLCLFRYDISQAPGSLAEMTLLRLKFSDRIYFSFVPMQVPTQNVSLSSAVSFLGERSAYRLSVLRPVFPPMPLICQSLPPYSSTDTTNMRQYPKLFSIHEITRKELLLLSYSICFNNTHFCLSLLSD